MHKVIHEVIHEHVLSKGFCTDVQYLDKIYITDYQAYVHLAIYGECKAHFYMNFHRASEPLSLQMHTAYLFAQGAYSVRL